MSAEAFRWLVGLNLVVGVWLGMLAGSWKGRSFYAWAMIGLVFNIVGLLVLALMPTLKTTPVPKRKVIEA